MSIKKILDWFDFNLFSIFLYLIVAFSLYWLIIWLINWLPVILTCNKK
jgi:hypothetical protein